MPKGFNSIAGMRIRHGRYRSPPPSYARETLIKSNSPRSNGHTHAVGFAQHGTSDMAATYILCKTKFDTLRFNHRIPDLIGERIMEDAMKTQQVKVRGQ